MDRITMPAETEQVVCSKLTMNTVRQSFFQGGLRQLSSQWLIFEKLLSPTEAVL